MHALRVLAVLDRDDIYVSGHFWRSTTMLTTDEADELEAGRQGLARTIPPQIWPSVTGLAGPMRIETADSGKACHAVFTPLAGWLHDLPGAPSSRRASRTAANITIEQSRRIGVNGKQWVDTPMTRKQMQITTEHGAGGAMEGLLYGIFGLALMGLFVVHMVVR
ncbi:hypothetical protein ACLBXM_07135 [Xanthobacteraceae bacterium A53D]